MCALGLHRCRDPGPAPLLQGLLDQGPAPDHRSKGAPPPPLLLPALHRAAPPHAFPPAPPAHSQLGSPPAAAVSGVTSRTVIDILRRATPRETVPWAEMLPGAAPLALRPPGAHARVRPAQPHHRRGRAGAPVPARAAARGPRSQCAAPPSTGPSRRTTRRDAAAAAPGASRRVGGRAAAGCAMSRCRCPPQEYMFLEMLSLRREKEGGHGRRGSRR